MDGFAPETFTLAALIRENVGMRARGGLGLERHLERFRREARAAAFEEARRVVNWTTTHHGSKAEAEAAATATQRALDAIDALAARAREGK